ncbi:hypothetical protein CC78DRAFT_574449 [Lojkania enalia]|uniref:Uncharacterized protein n=1 Tax=Lojkania enalia TaxID=147567 RepID=A0A9P4NBR2_9PLEO|nr:hypothetical protein CC78DRAFT_574449 [Didymosphaeria enalia]
MASPLPNVADSEGFENRRHRFPLLISALCHWRPRHFHLDAPRCSSRLSSALNETAESVGIADLDRSNIPRAWRSASTVSISRADPRKLLQLNLGPSDATPAPRSISAYCESKMPVCVRQTADSCLVGVRSTGRRALFMLTLSSTAHHSKLRSYRLRTQEHPLYCVLQEYLDRRAAKVGHRGNGVKVMVSAPCCSNAHWTPYPVARVVEAAIHSGIPPSHTVSKSSRRKRALRLPRAGLRAG